MSSEDRQLILASGSPRRRAILERILGSVTVLVADIDETPQPGESARQLVERLAVAKAVAVHRRGEPGGPDASIDPQRRVIGADTVVVLDEEILGKPADADDARRMLERLSGRPHQVMTGLAMVGRDPEGKIRAQSTVETTEVLFRELTSDEIAGYVATGEPDDKAGSYGIQGQAAIFVVGIVGSYDNVVGLPLHRLDQLARQSGAGLTDWSG